MADLWNISREWTDMEKRWPRLTCPNCKNKMGILAHFCGKCGTMLPVPKNLTPAQKGQRTRRRNRACQKFHHILVAVVGNKFCAECGGKIVITKA